MGINRNPWSKSNPIAIDDRPGRGAHTACQLSRSSFPPLQALTRYLVLRYGTY